MRNISGGGPKPIIEQNVRDAAALPGWLRRLGSYGLALLFVAAATTLCWAMPEEVLDPTPFLAFYLAWVAAAAFGGLGPGLLATAASWVCIDLLLDSTRWRMNLGDPVIMARFVIFVAGGVAVSLVAEAMRRGRLRLARIECNSNGRRSSCRVKPRSCRCRPRN